MASRDLNDLVPEMKAKADWVLTYCSERGVDLLIYCTHRSFEEQARLYRKGRTKSEITVKKMHLEEAGWEMLADIIDEVGAQYGDKVTNAAPGESWHNFKEAFDAVPMIDGKPAWHRKDAPEAWQIYGDAVKDAGAIWGGDWHFTDLPHAQLRKGNPLDVMNEKEVSDGMA